MNETVHFAYIRDDGPPRLAVCADNAVGILEYNIKKVTCDRCLDAAQRRWMLT